MDSWGGENPFIAGAQASPLSSDWSGLFANKLATQSWWASQDTPFAYGPDNSVGGSFDYDPGGTPGSPYGPISGLTNRLIDSDINNWLQREHPELFDFTGGVQYGGVAGAGKVGQDPNFGQFAKTPEVYAEIQAAANKYGVPANFLQAIIAKESSGNWAANSRPVSVGSRNGQRIHGYVGVFENAAKAWGFNFDALIGNRAGQIEMLASGLRRMYDQLHKQKPEWGWLNVAAMHYSGDPTMQYTPGDSYQHGTTAQYVAQMEGWWKALDAKAGNTWSNYTSVGQNTGIGSPQTQTWGQYSKWDQAIVGLAANTGAPANLMKSILRFGQENGLGYSNNFDQQFAPAMTTLANNYRQTGDWDKAAAATLGVSTSSPQFAKVEAYWDELNADMSGVFGGQGSQDRGAVNQMEAIWGGRDYSISQGHGPSAFANAHPGWYEYSRNVLGYLGHPGIDVVFPRGTPMFSPVSGTVITSGGTSSYSFYGNGSPGVGQLRIRLDNGDELILGHMQRISVQAGSRVTPGMAVGTSGGDGTGDHLHLEYRRPNSQFGGGWEAVDPKLALSGSFTGYNQGARTGLGYTQPLTFQNLMRAGASGMPLPSGATFVQGGGNSSWTNWLRNAMQGNDVQQNRAGGINYGNIYSSLGGGIQQGS
jgi:murein DD-endopeptidase MepM/ murein hydrolase activator NlpD